MKVHRRRLNLISQKSQEAALQFQDLLNLAAVLQPLVSLPLVAVLQPLTLLVTVPQPVVPLPLVTAHKDPQRKKRKTEMEKVEASMKNLFEKFTAQQEKVRKDAKEMEQKRIKLEERQAQREEIDMQFMMP